MTRLGMALVAALTAGLALSGCASTGTDDTSAGSTHLSVVGFSVLEAANQPVFADFEKTDAGRDVSIETSYGASGDQSRAVEGGLDADVVHFSLEPDITRLVDSGQVADTWKDNPTKGIVTSSVVAFMVRPGNPKHIEGWDDLVKPGVEVITPNPASSGSAKWNVLAAWAHVQSAGGTETEARKFVTQVLQHTIALPSSARDATTSFTEGNGDVLISYENEAILARANGAEVDYVVPDDTLLIENPAAVVKGADPAAQDLLDFLTTPQAQADYAQSGFRPVVSGVKIPEIKGANDPADPFPTPKHLSTIDDDFGGWDKANTEFFDENDGIITRIQQQTGTLGE